MKHSLLPKPDYRCYAVRKVDPTTTTTYDDNNENELLSSSTTTIMMHHNKLLREHSDSNQDNNNNNNQTIIDNSFATESSANICRTTKAQLRQHQPNTKANVLSQSYSYNHRILYNNNNYNKKSFSLLSLYGIQMLVFLLSLFGSITRFVCLVDASVSYSFQIDEPGEMECFFLRVPKDRETILRYVCVIFFIKKTNNKKPLISFYSRCYNT